MTDQFRCVSCQAAYPLEEKFYQCKKCGGLLEVRLDAKGLEGRLEDSRWRSKPLSVWRYKPFLLAGRKHAPITLGEGGTNLHRCGRLAKHLGLKRLFVKNEGGNPTGSFKDRGMTVGVTRALELGAKLAICASTGNTAASMAAYTAKADIKGVVVVPVGGVAAGKMAQISVYGADVIEMQGGFDKALEGVLEVAGKLKEVYLLNSVNPFRVEGQKTLAFEICEQLGSMPDWVVVPVGNAGNIAAIWKGFKEFHQAGEADGSPRMAGIQAAGASPIAEAVKKGMNEIKPVRDPKTVASAVRIGSPVNWMRALKAIYDSKGTAEAVTDREILEAQSLLARYEGLFVELAGATSLAGLRCLIRNRAIEKDETVVCVATGHGLKDVEAVVATSPATTRVRTLEGLVQQIKSLSSFS